MADKVLTIRLDEQKHRALRLFAVSQGRSVNAVVTELIDAELDRHSSGAGGTKLSREEFAAEILRRAGIDPTSAEHRAAAEHADAAVQRAGDGSTRQGAA